MMRVNRETLTLVQDTLFYNEELFTGLAYEFNDDGTLKQISVVQAGIQQGISNDIINPDSTAIRVDFNALVDLEEIEFDDDDDLEEDEEEYDPPYEEEITYTFQEKVFRGYVYQFNHEGILLEESYYADGCPISSNRKWYDSGIMMKSNLKEEMLEWYPDGQLKKRAIFESDKGTLFRINFDELGKLRFLRLTNFYAFDIHELDFVVFSDKLKLSGDAMNDQALEILNKKSRLLDVTCLGISRCDISERKIISVINDNITELDLIENIRMEPSIVDQITERFPKCKVYYDDKKHLKL